MKEDLLLDLFSLLGTWASLFALILSLIKIFSLSKNIEYTKVEINKALQKVDDYFILNKTSSLPHLISQIQIWIRGEDREKKIELIVVRLTDLVTVIRELSFDHNSLNIELNTISIDLSNVNNAIIKNSIKDLKFHIINKHLDELRAKITEIQNQRNPLKK